MRCAIGRFFLPACFFAASLVAAERATISVDASRLGAEVAPSLYGIFYEEINHAGDGGLYGELLKNRSFEETLPIEGCVHRDGVCAAPASPHYLTGQNKNWAAKWAFPTPWPGWQLEAPADTGAQIALATNAPLHPRNPVHLQFSIERLDATPVRLFNEGYWGIAARQGEGALLTFFARTPAGKNGIAKFRAGLVGTGGQEVARVDFDVASSSDWKKTTVEIPIVGNDLKARFFLQPLAAGAVDLDVVSLFPKATFKNRPNGLRPDIAQLLADLKPAFLRFPGGCVVEGATFANRYRWDQTIGPVEGRPGHWSLWDYRNIDGLGYHEFLQFCEDIGADGMYVCNVGLSCEFRNGDYLPEDRVGEQLDEAMGAIEYALGPADSRWGAERVKNGHPAPFPLKYIEIGNENHGPIYNCYYNLFQAAIKARWPQLVAIFNGGTGDTPPGPDVKGVDLFDEHYYRDPDWFFANASRYDRAPRDRGFGVYVGEYACNRNVGHGNLLAALSEAAFMMGMERNGDLIKLSSYAPLLFHVSDIKWPVNMIGYDCATSFGRSSYHVQKLFAQHRPDVNVSTTLALENPEAGGEMYAGHVGLGAWNTKVEYRDVVVATPDGKTVRLDAAEAASGWHPEKGTWETAGKVLKLTDAAEWQRGLFMGPTFGGKYTIRLQARKTGGTEGFLILFGGRDGSHYRQVNLGGWGNREHGIESIAEGRQQPVGSRVKGALQADTWYHIEVAVDGAVVEVAVNGKRQVRVGAPSGRVHAVAGLDRKANELVVKIVNGEERALVAAIDMSGFRPAAAGRSIVLAGRLHEENDLQHPTRIAPVETTFVVRGPKIDLELKSASLTVLRIPAAK